MTIRTHGRGTAATAFGLVGAAAAGFLLSRSPLTAVAAPPPPAPAAQRAPSDYGQRVVAYIYGTIPITREDLGEYLIARHGVEKIDLLVNKKIIEHACEKRGVTVTDAEVEASILADCDTIHVKKAEFVEKVVKKNFGQTIYEWKEDVVKPRLLLTKLVKNEIKVSDDDLHKAFEAEYGRKVNVRVIIWPRGEEQIAMREYDAVRKDDQGFRSQGPQPSQSRTGLERGQDQADRP